MADLAHFRDLRGSVRINTSPEEDPVYQALLDKSPVEARRHELKFVQTRDHAFELVGARVNFVCYEFSNALEM
jgi:hypothetical protein